MVFAPRTEEFAMLSLSLSIFLKAQRAQAAFFTI
jgi:hypothetical protein